MENNHTVTLYAIFQGVVQGVFFRATVKKHADTSKIKGTVKNLPDGSVELWAQGSKDAVDTFLKNIEKAPGAAVIHSKKITFLENRQDFEGFKILYR